MKTFVERAFSENPNINVGTAVARDICENSSGWAALITLARGNQSKVKKAAKKPARKPAKKKSRSPASKIGEIAFSIFLAAAAVVGLSMGIDLPDQAVNIWSGMGLAGTVFLPAAVYLSLVFPRGAIAWTFSPLTPPSPTRGEGELDGDKRFLDRARWN
jgi:hypothetical protein